MSRAQQLLIPTAAQVAYLLRDEFTDARAAGSVNGTPATPGPGTRMVTADTGNNLSISAGALQIAGVAGPYDPAVEYPESFARVAGRLLVAQLSGAANGPHIGFWTGRPIIDARKQHLFYSGQGRIRQSDYANLPAYNGFQPDHYTIVLRSTGAYYFIKGGTYTDWTLVWISTTLNQTPLYAGIAHEAVGAPTGDFFRIPAALWLPTPLAYDTFTRANGALGTSEASGPDGQGIAARTWTGGSHWTVASNEAINSPTAGADLITNGGFDADTDWSKHADWSIAAGVATKVAGAAARSLWQAGGTVGKWYKVIYTITAYTAGTQYLLNIVNGGITEGSAATFTRTGRLTAANFGVVANAAADLSIDNFSAQLLTLTDLMTRVETSTADVIAQVELDAVREGTQAGLVLNLDDESNPQNFVIAYHNGQYATLLKCVAGTYTSVISAAATYAAGKTLVVIKDGTSYSLYYNSVKIGSTSTISDAGIVSNTLHGMFSTYSGNQLDNLLIMPRGSGGEYARLNKWSSD